MAAEASPPILDAGLDRAEVRGWVGQLPDKEKDDLITNLIVDSDHAQIAVLLQRFLNEQAENNAPKTAGRTVGQLLEAAEAYTTERQRIEAERRAKEESKREREAAVAREKHLDSLMGREEQLWAEVDKLVATKQPKNYDQAVKLLVDLHDLAARSESRNFELRIEGLRQAHARKSSFMERLKKAGI